MSEIRVNEQLRGSYEGYYADAQEQEWRRIGAIDKAENIVALCGALPHATVLEIGSGEGSLLQRLSELAFGDRLYAIEISNSGVEATKRKAIPRVVDCSLFDGYRIPYADNAFDLAILSHVLEHAEHPRQLLYEAARVAHQVFVEVPLEDISRSRRDFVLDRVGHINFYSPRTIRWLLQSSGLRVLRQSTTLPSKAAHTFGVGRRAILNYYIKKTLLAVAPGIATRHFCFHESVVCERSIAK